MEIFYIAEENRKIKALELKAWLNEGILLKSLKKSARKKTVVLVGIPQSIHDERGRCGI